jgi:O-acetyl-ADP-ribose deacetylase (regulator of RNase III)
MIIHFIDTNPAIVQSWKEEFSNFPDIDIACADILSLAHNCLVSPANSYGFMDGGIDLAYYHYFGPSIQIRVQDAIARRPEGKLPVGASLLIPTGHRIVPYLIVAPTMELPMAVEAKNCYRALVAVLRTAAKYPSQISDIFCPGLATGVGMVDPQEAAKEMVAAYRDWIIKSNPP